MSLADWAGNGWLVEHQTSRQEIKYLLGVADRDMRDCLHPGLSEDWQLAITCNAALQCATAALAACGYGAAREAHHHRTIQSLAYTLQTDPRLIRHFDAFRKKRNIGSYEQVGLVSEKEAHEMLGLARTLRQKVERWLRRNHPNLLSE